MPIILGCISASDSREEALRNVQDAIKLCLEVREEEGWDLPDEYSIEQVEVVAAR